MTIRATGWFDDDAGFSQEPEGNPWPWLLAVVAVLAAALVVGGCV